MPYQQDAHEPYGELVLSPNGEILSAPNFFLKALQTTRGDHIFGLFDIERTPRLNFVRFESRGPLIEYHVIVESLLSDPYSFRYWFMYDKEGNSTFGIIDDTAVHRYEEWRFHQLRALVTNDVQNVVISEFRDKFTTLSVLTEALLEAGTDLPEVFDKLRNVSRSLETSINSIDHDFRADEQNLEDGAPVALQDLATTIPSWSRGTTIVDVSIAAEAKQLLINDAFLSRVLQPTVINAIEACTSGEGTVQISVQLSEHSKHFVIFSIKDNGVGMDVNTLARAEDPFFTTKPGHVGLGLSNVRQFVDMHGAKMSFRSSPSGTTVTLAIPIVR